MIRPDPREPFIPDVAQCEDWTEYAAWLDGGVEAIEALEITRLNLELNLYADGRCLVIGQIESMLYLGLGVKEIVYELDEVFVLSF